MTRKTFTGREKAIFAAMVLICLVFGLYRGVFVPLRERGESIKVKITKTEKALVRQRKAVRMAKVMDSRFEDVLKDFRQNASDEQVMSGILSEVQQVAGDLEMRIADMKPRRVRSTDNFNQFSVSMALDGNLADIMRFIYQLENPPHLFYVEEMSLAKVSPRASELRCQMILSRMMIP